MLLPVMATFLPYRHEALMICCTLCTFVEKVAIMTRLSQLNSSLSSEELTTVSDGVYPGRSTLVDSQSSANTPFEPSAASLARSMDVPSGGVRSILKSPVCTTTPAGEVYSERGGIGNAVIDGDEFNRKFT